MKSNKIFFDLYSTGGSRTDFLQYLEYYKKNDIVYIVLVDSKIYTKVKRETMFEMGLEYGCFIETRPFNTPQEVEENAMSLVKKLNAKYVEPQEFKKNEQEYETKRAMKAFAYSEKLIREN